MRDRSFSGAYFLSGYVPVELAVDKREVQFVGGIFLSASGDPAKLGLLGVVAAGFFHKVVGLFVQRMFTAVRIEPNKLYPIGTLAQDIIAG